MENGILVSDEDTKEYALMNDSSQSWMQSTPQLDLVQALQMLPNLGLKLSKTPSFLNKLDQLVQEQNYNRDQASPNSAYVTAKAKIKDTLQQANKLKAENFPISLLKIGSWQRVSRNEGDLVAKFYFAKRKLVWEFLENALKSKIEIQWSDILSLKAVIQEDQSGTLEIELNQPPSFHHEIDPQPRKHTQWRMVSDFTGGQAPTFRRHYLEFPPGALEKPLEKLLRCDNRLFQLSRQGYPTLECPYFQKHTFGIDFSFDFGGQQHVNPEQQQFLFSNVSSQYLSQYFQTFEQKTQKSINLKDSDSPISDEHTRNQMPGQGMNNVKDSLITNQVGGMSFTTALVPQVNSTISFQNSHIPSYVQEVMKNQHRRLVPTLSTSQMHPIALQETERHQSSFQILNDLQTMLSNNSETEVSNGMTEDNLSRERHLTNNISNVTANYGQNMVDNVVVMSNNLSSSVDNLIYPQVASWPQSQVSHENMNMNLLPDNNSFSSSATMEYFPNFNHEFNDWIWKSE
ncbi:uncharacterized protein LOC111277961 isoform X2 [Durio zibethinus]|uniref:Uncharacterized protein LOC111277961 isoform X2 n=1 Tax=Durio zibethinus TaxID=66656 RepID=A0A6P5WXA8_DURZI|nr:uncharacterized protein LOC111277961 isoform X2 [Durio zibethinus]